jgi:Flp pilus assembly pilin Flp
MTSLINSMRRFLKAEDGVVTVEWVAIAAALTIGAIVIAWTVLDSLQPAASTIGSTINDAGGPLPPNPFAP